MNPTVPVSPGSVIMAAVRDKQRQAIAEEGQPTTIIADPTQSIAIATTGKPLAAYPPKAPEPPKRLIGDRGKLGTLGPSHTFDLAPASMAILREQIKFALTEDETASLRAYQARCEPLIALINANTPQKIASVHKHGLEVETIGADRIDAFELSGSEKQKLAREKRRSAMLELDDLLLEYRPACVEILRRLLKDFEDELIIVEEHDAARAEAYGVDHSTRSEIFLAVNRAIENLRVHVTSELKNFSGEVTPRTLLGQFVEF